MLKPFWTSVQEGFNIFSLPYIFLSATLAPTLSFSRNSVFVHIFLVILLKYFILRLIFMFFLSIHPILDYFNARKLRNIPY